MEWLALIKPYLPAAILAVILALYAKDLWAVGKRLWGKLPNVPAITPAPVDRQAEAVDAYRRFVASMVAIQADSEKLKQIHELAWCEIGKAPMVYDLKESK